MSNDQTYVKKQLTSVMAVIMPACTASDNQAVLKLTKEIPIAYMDKRSRCGFFLLNSQSADKSVL